MLRYCCFCCCCKADGFSHFCTCSVILISRQCYSRQNTNNRHNDHQFNQGETFLYVFHVVSPRFFRIRSLHPASIIATAVPVVKCGKWLFSLTVSHLTFCVLAVCPQAS